MNSKHHKTALSVLFETPGTELNLSERDKELKLMYEDVFTKWISAPHLSDKKITNYIQNRYGRSRSQAYIDIGNIKQFLGNIPQAKKEFFRFRVIEMLLYCYSKAKKEGNTRDMVLAADKLGKYTKLDKEEMDAIPWEDIIPPSWEPSVDLKLLGINIKDPEEIEALKEKLRKKYLPRVSDIDALVVKE